MSSVVPSSLSRSAASSDAPAPAHSRRSKSPHRSREKSPHEHDRSHDRRRSRSRSRSRSPRRKGGVKNRADYTIFVTQIHPRVTDEDLFEFFSLVGQVDDIRLIRDPKTGKSKGLCYVEFADHSCVSRAQALSGQLLGGYPITIQQPKLEKKDSKLVNVGGGRVRSADSNPDAMRVYVGSLNFNITENDIRPVFEAFGELDSVEIHRDAQTGQSKGFGFIQYKRSADAKTAMSALNGIEIGGRPMKVGNASAEANKAAAQANSSFMANQLINPLINQAFNPAVALPLTLPLPLVGLSPGLPSPSLSPPSPCLLLKHMFNPKEEKDPDFHLDVEDDVRDEVEKFARVRHIYVDRDNEEGLVWLKLDSIESGVTAQKNLHGRWFANRQIVAEFIPEPTYSQRFPGN